MNRLSWLDESFERKVNWANEGLILARKLKNRKWEDNFLTRLGSIFWASSNYPLALHYNLGSLKIREELKDPGAIASCYNNIGNCYVDQGDFKNALLYYYKAEVINHKINNDDGIMTDALNIGRTYIKMKQYDSALKYFNMSYEIVNNTADKYKGGAEALAGLGNTHLQLGNIPLAREYYKMGIPKATSYQDWFSLALLYQGMGELFEKTNDIDSAAHYAHLALDLSLKNKNQPVVISSALLLSGLSERSNDKDALHYHKIAMAAKDSTFNTDKAVQLQNLAYIEQERQKEMESVKLKVDAERKTNLQYAAIALGLVIFIILFLLFSHTVVANQKWIKFLGILALLIVFEFINLFLHPYLGNLTNHSPLLMLGIMVCIAALLIPLHHQLEKWITHKLTEKNRKIRLAAAKKIMAELGGEQED